MFQQLRSDRGYWKTLNKARIASTNWFQQLRSDRGYWKTETGCPSRDRTLFQQLRSDRGYWKCVNSQMKNTVTRSFNNYDPIEDTERYNIWSHKKNVTMFQQLRSDRGYWKTPAISLCVSCSVWFQQLRSDRGYWKGAGEEVEFAYRGSFNNYDPIEDTERYMALI